MEQPGAKNVHWKSRFTLRNSSRPVEIDVEEVPTSPSEDAGNKKARLFVEECSKNYELWSKNEVEGDIYGIQDERMRIIFRAVLNGDVADLDDELKNNFGSVKQAVDAKGRTVSHIAAYLGLIDIMEHILDSGIMINEVGSPPKVSPLDCACARGHTQIVNLLLSHGTTITYGERSSLHWAVSGGSVSCVNALISAGSIQTSSPEPEGLTPVLLASALGFHDIVELLLHNGADPNGVQLKSLDTGLHIAAIAGSSKCAKLFLDHKVSAHCRNVWGETAMHLSTSPEVTRLLIARGTVLDVINVHGRTPLHFSVLKDRFDIIEVLLHAGASVNAKDKHGDTSLHLAARTGSSKLVLYLLKHGANATIINSNGHSALGLMQITKPHVLENLKDSLDCAVKVSNSDPDEHDCALELDFSYVGMVPKPVKENRSSKILSRDQSYASRLLEGAQFLRLESTFLHTAAEGRSKSIFCHPLIEAFLVLKWRQMRCIFYANFVFYVVMAIAYTFFVMERYMKLCPAGSTRMAAQPYGFRNVGTKHSTWGWGIPTFGTDASTPIDVPSMMDNNSTPDIVPMDSLRNVSDASVTDAIEPSDQCLITTWQIITAWYIVVFTAGIATLKEIGKLVQCYRNFMSNLENLGQVAMLILIVVTSSWNVKKPCDCNIVTKWKWLYSAAALGILLSWSMLLVRIGKFPKFGIYVPMLGKVLKNFGRLILVYITILNAFALAFCVVLPGEPPFSSYLQAMIKIFTMMVGELGYDEMFYEVKHKEGFGMFNTMGRFSFAASKDLDYPLQTHLLYCIFVAVISISLMNLLVGLAVSDIQSLENKAKVDRLFRQSQSVVRFERFLFSSVTKKTLPTYVLAHLKTKLLVQPLTAGCKFTVRPNDPTDVSLPEDLKFKLLNVASENLTKAHKLATRRKEIFRQASTPLLDAQINDSDVGSECVEGQIRHIQNRLSVLLQHLADKDLTVNSETN